MPNTINNTDDIIDVRDVIARVEELENERDDYMLPNRDGHMTAIGADWEADHPDENKELAQLTAILDDLKGYGGDEQWRGDWYPVTLIRDSYFQDYAEELADDIGAVDRNASWPMTCIDWEEAARQLQQDYSTIDIDGVTYWYR